MARNSTRRLQRGAGVGLLSRALTTTAAACATPPSLRRVVACGRGRDICAPPIRDTIIALTCKATPSLLYLGTPAFESPDALRMQTEGFAKMGCAVAELDLTTPPLGRPGSEAHKQLTAAIAAADIIAVSGGNTLFAMARWSQLGVPQLLHQAMQRGAVMCGGSAGAICWFDGGHSDSLDPASVLEPALELTEADKKNWAYVRVAGIGLIPGLCCPHHDQVQSNGVLRATDFDRMLLRNPAEVGICIDNEAAWVVDGDSWRVVSAREGAGVMKKVYTNGAVVSTRLPTGGSLRGLEALMQLPDFTSLPSSR